MEKFTKKCSSPWKNRFLSTVSRIFEDARPLQYHFFRLRKNSIKFSAGFQIFSVSRKTLLKTEVFEKRAKDQRNEIYRLCFLVHRVWLYPLLTFGLQFSFIQNLCIFWVTFCNTYDFLGITSFTKKQNFSEKDIWPTFSRIIEFGRLPGTFF